MYIYEREEWPGFHWDSEALAGPLAQVRHKQGRHLGKMEAVGFDVRAEASVETLTADVVKSSAIEGETLSEAEVRSSVARELGVDVAGLPRAGRRVQGVVEMALDATRHFDRPLTVDRLFRWHAALFPRGSRVPQGYQSPPRMTVGAWRTDQAGRMRVISGRIGKERVHFEAPPAARLPAEVATFLEWFERHDSVDWVLKAGVAHLWFLTLHPFDDGNGRIGRVVADMALSRADRSADRFFSLSAGIEATLSEYYGQLESAQRGGLDVTPWLTWFLSCLDRTLDAAEHTLGHVFARAEFWSTVEQLTLNERQRKVMNRLLGPFEGKLTSSKYAKLAKCSRDTALRDIKALVELGVLERNPQGGRSTSYRTAQIIPPRS